MLLIKAQIGGVIMKADIDRKGCISCGFCTNTCPEIFAFAEDGKAEVIKNPVPERDFQEAEAARDLCPVSVISLT